MRQLNSSRATWHIVICKQIILLWAKSIKCQLFRFVSFFGSRGLRISGRDVISFGWLKKMKQRPTERRKKDRMKNLTMNMRIKWDFASKYTADLFRYINIPLNTCLDISPESRAWPRATYQGSAKFGGTSPCQLPRWGGGGIKIEELILKSLL